MQIHVTFLVVVDFVKIVVLCYNDIHLMIVIVGAYTSAQPVVETPKHSQVESTTWPLAGTTCPVGTEYTIKITSYKIGAIQVLRNAVLCQLSQKKALQRCTVRVAYGSTLLKLRGV